MKLTDLVAIGLLAGGESRDDGLREEMVFAVAEVVP
jgi:hypothetical protein